MINDNTNGKYKYNFIYYNKHYLFDIISTDLREKEMN
jgi:hypothetical protein